MSPNGSQTLRSAPLARLVRTALPMLFSVLAATTLAACGRDAGSRGEPAVSGSAGATPSSTTPAAASVGRGLIVFERVVPGAEDRDLYTVGPDGGEPRLLTTGPGDYP